MQDFQRKKDSFLLFNNLSQRENNLIFSEQSKNLYDFVLKNDSKIKKLENDIINIKSQLLDLNMKLPKNLQKIDINNAITEYQKNEMKEKFDNLKQEIELFNDEKNENNKILEINENLETLNQQLMQKEEEKSNLENIILNKLNNDKLELSNNINNINKRMDNLDIDFDRLVQSLKNQFSENANTITKLDISKVNSDNFQNQINLINQNIEKISSKINSINLQDINRLIINNNNKNFSKNNNTINYETEQKIASLKEDIYADIEKINLKILNEIKNQANDIKILYQKFQYYEEEKDKTLSNKEHEINFDSPKNLTLSENSPDKYNILSLIDSELSKKANLDQLNYALETQSKLNEAFSSASRICRFCWDSEGLLKNDKYIIWSIQNINTALDIFKWEKNSENIIVMQNGVYKIVFGLIGLEKNKNFGISFNDDENLVLYSKEINNNYNTNESENENDINNDKGNMKYLEKYIACAENTNIKAIIYENSNDITNNEDNSEEAFLEISKII